MKTWSAIFFVLLLICAFLVLQKAENQDPLPKATSPTSAPANLAHKPSVLVREQKSPLQTEASYGVRVVSLKIEGEDGAPASEAEVRLFLQVSGEELGPFLSDADGVVQIPTQAHGDALAIANWQSAGYRMSGSRRVVLDTELPIQIVSLSSSTTSIFGMVRRNANPVVGISVQGVKAGIAVTDGSGLFELSGFPPGPFILRIGSRENTIFNLESSIELGEQKFIIIELPASAIRVTASSILDPEKLIEGVPVAIESMPALLGSVRRFSHTQGDGAALFDAVKPGKYLVSTGHIFPDDTLRSSYPNDWAPSFEVAIVSTGIETVNLQIQKPAELHLRVFDSDLEYQVPAEIFFRIPEVGIVRDRGHKFLAGREGYSVFKVPSGSIEVIATQTFGGWAELHLNLLPGQITEADIWLTKANPSLTINVSGPNAHQIDAFQIHDRNGGLIRHWRKLLSRSSMSARKADGTTELVSTTSEPAQGDEFSKYLPALPVGLCIVTCFAEGEVIATGEIELTKNSELTLSSIQ
jgi:hypothetical protein